MATYTVIYEGNSVIINIYAEADKPKEFWL